MDFKEYGKRGLAFFEKGEIGQAIENFEAALRIQPNDAEVREFLEQLKLLKKDQDTRKYCERKLESLKPDYETWLKMEGRD